MTLVMTYYGCCCSITNSCLNLCDFMSNSMPAFSDFLDTISNHNRCKEELISGTLLNKNLLCQKEYQEQEDKSQTWRKYLQRHV